MTNPAPNNKSSRLIDKIGLCQWFHYEAYDDVVAAIEVMQDLGLTHLRTGISWADFLRPQGQAWYDWQMQALHDAGLELLLSVWHVPPSLSADGTCSAPPRRLRDYADFIDQVITRYGDQFGALELWNEPNNRYKWNFPDHDPQWAKFGEMIGMAAYWAQHRGKATVLGGMIPVDHTWLQLMMRYGVLASIDVVAIHAFPEMWWDDAPNWEWFETWRGWAGQIAYIAKYAEERPIWVTETGLATWDLKHQQVGRYELQIMMLKQALAAPVARLYWYSAIDLAPEREAIEGFHVDENEYHMGLVTYKGMKKPAYDWLKAHIKNLS
ncbi:MAG: family 1 glycosylhydrolase [Caldilineaceae bacterium]